MPLTYSEKNTIVNLDVLEAGLPYILYLEPFVGELNFKLKLPECEYCQGFSCYLSNYRDGFTTPYYFSDFYNIPDFSYLILFFNGNHYVALFSLSHQDLISHFYTNDHQLYLKVKSGISKEANKKRPAMICLSHTNVYELLEECMKIALKETGGLGKLASQKQKLGSHFFTLGWQSHLAYGLDVSHEKIQRAIKSLHNEGVYPGFIIIEEGWQRLENSLLYSFEADAKQFPFGLKGLVQELHEKGIKQVGVWHGVMGSRNGIHPRLAKLYDLPPDNQGRYFLGYDLGRTFQFFYDYYAFLKEQGISFVKVGDQENIYSFCRTGMDATKLYKNLQTAIQAASGLHFNGSQFNTDCLRNENLFYWTSSQIARTSADLMNETPVAVHIRNNLVNSLWVQYLMHVDFGTWISKNDYRESIAIFHALSGSFNKISDPPGYHNSNLLKKMVLPSGLIMRADQPLRLCEDSLFVDPLLRKQIYKAYTAKNQTGVIAAFNFFKGKQNLFAYFSPKDVYRLKGECFAAFSYRQGFLGTVAYNETICLKFKSEESDILTFAPLHSGIAIIGCYLFYLTAGPILEINYESDAVHISSMIAAPLLLYCERKILEVRRNGQVIPWSQDNRCHLVSIDNRTHIQEISSYYTIAFES